MVVVSEPLPIELANATLVDAAGEPSTLAQVAGGKTTLVLFVRQFACAGCSEQVAALLPQLPALRVLDVGVVIVGCGTVDHARGFDERLGVTSRGVRVFTDPTLVAQRAAGLSRSRLGVFGPRGTLGLLRAMMNGHKNAWSGGDFYQQGGALLLSPSLRVLFYRPQRWLGDLVEIGDITDVVLAGRARENAAALDAAVEAPS